MTDADFLAEMAEFGDDEAAAHGDGLEGEFVTFLLLRSMLLFHARAMHSIERCVVMGVRHLRVNYGVFFWQIPQDGIWYLAGRVRRRRVG